MGFQRMDSWALIVFDFEEKKSIDASYAMDLKTLLNLPSQKSLC